MSIQNLTQGFSLGSNLKLESIETKDKLLIPQYTVLPAPQNGLIVSYDDGSGYELWYSDGSLWSKVSGGAGTGGDVVGPATATDSHIALYDGTSGKLLKNSPVEITPTNANFFTLAVRTSHIASVSTDLTNKNYVDTSITNGLGNLYAGLSDSNTVAGTVLTSLVPLTGDGTLSVPANSFTAGNSYHLVVAGTGVFQNGNTVTVRLCSNGTALGTIVIDLENANPTSWELEADFSIRSIGPSASIAVNFDFTYQRPSPSFDFRGAREVNISSIDTTIVNTLDVDAQFSGGVNNMTTKLFYLKKMH